MVKSTFHKLIEIAGFAFIAALIILIDTAGAQTIYPGGTGLATGDVNTSHILNGTILNEDISATAGIAAAKITTTTDKDWVTTGTQSIAGTKTFTGAVNFNGQTTFAIPNPAATIQTTAIANENISKGDAVRIYKGENDLNASGTLQDLVNANFGYSGVSEASGQSFTSPATSSVLRGATIVTGYRSAPAAAAVFVVSPDNNGVPSSTVFGSASIAVGSLTGGNATYTIAFSPAVSLVANTRYWLVATTTQQNASPNYFRMGYFDFNAYSGGYIAGFNGTAWASSTANDWAFQTLIDSPDMVMKASAANATTSNPFIGFADAAITAGNSGTIDLSGVASIFSGLLTGEQYYLGDTAGSVSSTPGTLTHKVGIAKNSSTLDITNIW